MVSHSFCKPMTTYKNKQVREPMVEKMKIGDKIKCLEATEQAQDLGIVVGGEYVANSVHDLTGMGDKQYVGIYLGETVWYDLAERYEVVEEAEEEDV